MAGSLQHCVVLALKLQALASSNKVICMDNFNNNLTGSWKSIPLRRLWALKGGVFNTHHIYMYITAVSVNICPDTPSH